MIKQLICLYSGRFQPFGKHHAGTFLWLEEKFGKENCFICTSDKTEPEKSPFNFEEKKAIIDVFGFGNQTIQVKSPYFAQEVIAKYNANEISVVYAIGKKDLDRLEGKKFFEELPKNYKLEDLKPSTEKAYYIITPHFSVNIPGQGEMSGTTIRAALANSTSKNVEKLFNDIFGWYAPKMAKYIVDKIKGNMINENFDIYIKESWDKFFKKVLKEEITPEDIKRILKRVENDKKAMALIFDDDQINSNLSLSPEDCNNGLCDIWAEKFKEEYPEAEIWDTEETYGETHGHVWVKYDGKFYDAETPNGVTDWKQLPFMKRFYKIVKKLPTDVKKLNENKCDKCNKEFNKTYSKLKEGGTGGHIAHPFDFTSTGSELIDVFKKSIESIEKGSSSVKIDGVNSSIRLTNIDGKLQFVIDRGSATDLDIKGVTKTDLPARFKSKDDNTHGFVKIGGTVLDIFNSSIPSTKQELEKLDLLNNPDMLLNIEYVEGKTNVIGYENIGNFLSIHGLKEIKPKNTSKTGKIRSRQSSEVGYDKNVMETYINKLNKVAKKFGFKVLGSVDAEFKSKPNLDKPLSEKVTLYPEGKPTTKTLGEWLKDVKIETPLITRNKFIEDNGKQFQDSKTLNDSIIYTATIRLGDEILSHLTSEIGELEKHEGIVIRDNNIYSGGPFKITGKFILQGMDSKFGGK